MPVIEIEVGDEGPLGPLPEVMQRFVNAKMAETRREAEAKMERKLTPYLADPAELARLQQRDKDLAKIELEIAERDKKYDEAKKIREEGFAKEKAEAVAAEKKNTARAIERVRSGVAKSIRAAAVQHGARPESLEELERLLSAHVDLDEELNEFVTDPTDRKKPRLVKDGDKDVPLSIEGFVADYLKTHPHHVAAPSVKGGKAPGGATLSGRPSVPGDARAQARDRVAENPSDRNIGALLAGAVRGHAA